MRAPTRSLCFLLLVAALAPVGAQISRVPPIAADTTRRLPDPRVPCTINCTALDHESWRQLDSRIDVGAGAGIADFATSSGTGLSVPVLQANGAWTRTFRGWSFGSAVRGWTAPAGRGVEGWGGAAMVRFARSIFDGGPELQVGTGVGIDRLTVTSSSTAIPFGTRQDHAGIAYEAGLAQEFRRGPSLGILLSAGLTGLQADGGYPNTPRPMFVAGLGLRWHSWSGTQRETQGSYPRDGPRWPRPLP